MTNIQHPITPPPELMQRWREQAPRYRDGGVGREYWLMARAAQWGADQELEACCSLLNGADIVPPDDAKTYPENQLAARERVAKLRAARRPKPPNLKAQALAALSRADKDALTNPLTGEVVALRTILSKEQSNTIRRALERLQELEKGND